MEKVDTSGVGFKTCLHTTSNATVDTVSSCTHPQTRQLTHRSKTSKWNWKLINTVNTAGRQCWLASQAPESNKCCVMLTL